MSTTSRRAPKVAPRAARPRRIPRATAPVDEGGEGRREDGQQIIERQGNERHDGDNPEGEEPDADRHEESPAPGRESLEPAWH